MMIELVEKSKDTGMEINTVIGDTAYSGKDNLQSAQTEEIQLISQYGKIDGFNFAWNYKELQQYLR
ncbi:hypothetical protein ACQKMD_06975 [Viridibacillus sp. NPDC096237]|uniref:hypothetical protein n=1 Tax=Viridibacillus sp. NPDC096237 TaxID=3390721 RepID=UPI003D019B0D